MLTINLKKNQLLIAFSRCALLHASWFFNATSAHFYKKIRDLWNICYTSRSRWTNYLAATAKLFKNMQTPELFKNDCKA